jgi:hypothetical protein
MGSFGARPRRGRAGTGAAMRIGSPGTPARRTCRMSLERRPSGGGMATPPFVTAGSWRGLRGGSILAARAGPRVNRPRGSRGGDPMPLHAENAPRPVTPGLARRGGGDPPPVARDGRSPGRPGSRTAELGRAVAPPRGGSCQPRSASPGRRRHPGRPPGTASRASARVLPARRHGAHPSRRPRRPAGPRFRAGQARRRPPGGRRASATCAAHRVHAGRADDRPPAPGVAPPLRRHRAGTPPARRPRRPPDGTFGPPPPREGWGRFDT